ncbi:cytochrome P450 2C5-like [Podarcis lilfordi]|uniref:Cytochrome P450 2C5-like n=1 Tax=Podarcis lilfordi TaxID=74358 RepID=A0AA35NZK4_9SAUR|nr:cytochrome P450 2C5-like [Podarcis lilfordi]
MVVLCGYEIMKDALVSYAEEFGGQSSQPILETVTKNLGISTRNKKKWKELHRFTLSTLQNIGMGKKSMAERIQEEVHCLVEVIATTKDRHLQIEEEDPAPVESTLKLFFKRNISEPLTIPNSFFGTFVDPPPLLFFKWVAICPDFPGYSSIFPDTVTAIFRLCPGNSGRSMSSSYLYLHFTLSSADLILNFLPFSRGDSNLTISLSLLNKSAHSPYPSKGDLSNFPSPDQTILHLSKSDFLQHIPGLVPEWFLYSCSTSMNFPKASVSDTPLPGSRRPLQTTFQTLACNVFASIYLQKRKADFLFRPSRFSAKLKFHRKKTLQIAQGKRACPGEALA